MFLILVKIHNYKYLFSTEYSSKGKHGEGEMRDDRGRGGGLGRGLLEFCNSFCRIGVLKSSLNETCIYSLSIILGGISETSQLLILLQTLVTESD